MTLAAATRKDALTILRSAQEVDVLFTDIILRGDKRAGLVLAEKAVVLKPKLYPRDQEPKASDRRGEFA